MVLALPNWHPITQLVGHWDNHRLNFFKESQAGPCPEPSLFLRADPEVAGLGGPQLPSLASSTQSTSITSQEQPHFIRAFPSASWETMPSTLIIITPGCHGSLLKTGQFLVPPSAGMSARFRGDRVLITAEPEEKGTGVFFNIRLCLQ